MKLTTRQIALVAVFAALYYVLSIVSPYVPAIGLPELTISLEALMASVFGLVLGPFLGALTAFMGAFVVWALPPVGLIPRSVAPFSPAGMPFLLSPPLNALIVGLVYYRRWREAFVVFGVLIAAFLFLPPSQPLSENYLVGIAVIWDKIIALLLILPCVKFGKKFSSEKSLPILYFLLSFIGNQADNMWGADIFAVPMVYEGIFGLPLGSVNAPFTVRWLFVISPFIYPAIRFIQAIVATIIATPLMRALKKTEWLPQTKTIIQP